MSTQPKFTAYQLNLIGHLRRKVDQVDQGLFANKREYRHFASGAQYIIDQMQSFLQKENNVKNTDDGFGGDEKLPVEHDGERLAPGSTDIS